MGVRVDIGERQLVEPAKRIAPDVAHDAEGHAVVAHAHDPLRQRRHAHANADGQRNPRHARKVDLARADDPVHRLAGEDGHVQRQRDGHGRQQQRQDEQWQIVPEIAQHAAQRGAPGGGRLLGSGPAHARTSSSGSNCEA